MKILCLRYAFTTCKLHRTVCFCPIQYILPASKSSIFFVFIQSSSKKVQFTFTLTWRLLSVFSCTFLQILVIFQLSTSTLRLLQPFYRNEHCGNLHVYSYIYYRFLKEMTCHGNEKLLQNYLELHPDRSHLLAVLQHGRMDETDDITM